MKLQFTGTSANKLSDTCRNRLRLGVRDFHESGPSTKANSPLPGMTKDDKAAERSGAGKENFDDYIARDSAPDNQLTIAVATVFHKPMDVEKSSTPKCVCSSSSL